MEEKFVAPSAQIASVEIEGARTGVTETIARDSKGYFTPRTQEQAQALKNEGFTVGGVAVGFKTRFVCEACGRHMMFLQCPDCGHTNENPWKRDVSDE